MNNNNRLFCALLYLSLHPLSALADDELIDKAFYPYRAAIPKADGLNTGMLIESDNVERFKELLDPAMLGFIRQGWTRIEVVPTTSFDLHPHYVEATRKHLHSAKLGANPGEISGTIAGRPFPAEPDAADPRAGEKLAWNVKYGYNWGDSAIISPFIWKYRNIDSPQDLRNTQLLIHRFNNDLKRDNSWLYLGFQRRVRRLATGQMTDAFLGSDLMIEDFEGYNGRIADMRWSYQGTRVMLMPFYNHNDLALDEGSTDSEGYRMVAFDGKGNCARSISCRQRRSIRSPATRCPSASIMWMHRPSPCRAPSPTTARASRGRPSPSARRTRTITCRSTRAAESRWTTASR